MWIEREAKREMFERWVGKQAVGRRSKEHQWNLAVARHVFYGQRPLEMR